MRIKPGATFKRRPQELPLFLKAWLEGRKIMDFAVEGALPINQSSKMSLVAVVAMALAVCVSCPVSAKTRVNSGAINAANAAAGASAKEATASNQNTNSIQVQQLGEDSSIKDTNIVNQADDAQKAGSKASTMYAALSTTLAGVCAASLGWDSPACLGAAAAAVGTTVMAAGAQQAGSTRDQAGINLDQFRNLYDQSMKYNGEALDPSKFGLDGDPDSKGGLSKSQIDQLNSVGNNVGTNLDNALKELDKKGVRIQGNNLIGPDGRSVPLKAFDPSKLTGANLEAYNNALAEAGRKAGMDQDAINKLKAGGKGAQDALNDFIGGSTKAASTEPTEEAGVFAPEADWWKRFQKGSGQAPKRDVAGLITRGYKDYYGDPIGLANDNIFEMIHYRYQEKRQQKSFLPP